MSLCGTKDKKEGKEIKKLNFIHVSGNKIWNSMKTRLELRFISLIFKR